jgi:enoyl-[acyl-carrier protein] reductase III
MRDQHKPFAGKTVLITGGARGIGAATARKFARAGCDVAINYFNSSDAAEVLADELRELGVRACTLAGSVADTKSVADLFTEFKDFSPQLDFLINNAASGVLKPALEMKLKHWRWCLETNAFSLNLVTQQARPLMPSGSRIVALSSLGASRAIPNYAFIGASKAALEALVRSLSLELAPFGIGVNTVSAGVVDTDALKYFPNRESLLETYRNHSLAGRDLQPSDVADAVYLLCLPEAQMIMGQTITVDAGYAMIG